MEYPLLNPKLLKIFPQSKDILLFLVLENEYKFCNHLTIMTLLDTKYLLFVI